MVGGEEEEPQRRGRGQRGMSRGRKESCTGQLVTAGRALQDGPCSPPRACSHRQQGLHLLSPPLRSFRPVLDTDGDRHWSTDKGPRLRLLLGAVRTEQRGELSAAGHVIRRNGPSPQAQGRLVLVRVGLRPSKDRKGPVSQRVRHAQGNFQVKYI